MTLGVSFPGQRLQTTGPSSPLDVERQTPAGNAQNVAPDFELPKDEQTQAFFDVRTRFEPPKPGVFKSDDPALQALLDDPDADLETLILAQMAINNKQLDLMNKAKAGDIEANQKLAEQNQAERKKEIEASKAKIESAEKKGFWGKLLGVISKVAAVVGTVVAIAGAIAAGPVGWVAGVALAYSLATTIYEIANDINVAVNGEKARWPQITLGAGIAWVAGQLKASDEVKMWIGAAVDVALSIALAFANPFKALSAAKQFFTATSSLISSVTKASSAGLNIAAAYDKWALSDVTAKLDTLQAQIDRLNQSNRQLFEMLKNIQQARADNDNTATEVLELAGQSNRRITMA